MFRQSPETRQSFKLPAFLLKFWAKRIVEIISIYQEPRESEILLQLQWKLATLEIQIGQDLMERSGFGSEIKLIMESVKLVLSNRRILGIMQTKWRRWQNLGV